jgi:ketosteroid isomerase-like protein
MESSTSPRDTPRAMSPQNVAKVVGVRTPVVASAEPTQRTLDERVFVRFPALVRALLFVYARLPPSSRVRRAFTARSLRRFAAAFNRGDLDVLLPFLHPQVKFEGAESLVGGYGFPDLPKAQHGREEYRRMCEAMIEGWDDLTFRSEEVIDLGDRLFGVSHVTGHGRFSGIALDIDLFQVVTLRNGMIVHQRDFGERGKALEAAGLSG